MLSVYRSLYDYRGFISGSVQREFQARYRNSLLGALWPIFNPLSMIVIYTVVFSHIMHARLPGVDDGMAYSIYLCAGLLAWGLFSEITLRSQNMFLDNANLLKKVSFPKICLPTIVLINAGINFAIIIGLFLGFLLITGRWPGVALLSLVPLIALQMMLCAGLGMVLGILNVFFRDVGQLFGICLQFWFWLTPIIYPITILPEPLQKLLRFNPLTNLIGSYQNLFVYGQWPIWSSLLPTFVTGAVFCTMGLYLFRKQVGAMEDEL